MPEILSKKKKKWVGQFKPTGAVRGTVLNYNAGVQTKYERELIRLVNRMAIEVERELTAFFKKPASKEWFETNDASISSDARILTSKLTAKFQQLFNRKSRVLALSMVKESDRTSASAMHASLKELSGGLSFKTSVISGEMHDLMKAAVAENVGLIRSISQDYLTQVQGAVMRSITTGQGLKDLTPFLEKRKEITVRRARNIALDQTRKAYNALNEGRMRKIGVDQYEWLHTGGSQHPRPDHVAMSGNIYSIDNPPIIDQKTGQRGKPGDLPNCGCRMRPVVTFDKGVPDEPASN